MGQNTNAAEDPKREFVTTRELNAPRAAVWRAWTDANELQRWFGPKGFTMPTCKLDFRPGGTFLYGLKPPQGGEMWGKFVYREIVPQQKIVLINSFSDANAGVTRHPFNPRWPLELQTTTTFEEQGGKTLITIRWIPTEKANADEWKAFDEGRTSMTQGWGGTFEQLENYLAKQTMKIEPYLFFEGRAEEAIEFYKKTLGAQTVMMMRFKESPDTSGCPPGPGMGEKIMHATLQIGATSVMLSDGRCSGASKFDGFSLSISAANAGEAEKFFKGLSDGGQVIMPMGKTFFSPAFGMTQDRFGVNWMVIVPMPMP